MATNTDTDKTKGVLVDLTRCIWCFGWQYPGDARSGDSANILTPFIGDANTMIPESKAFMVNLQKA